MTDWIRAAVRTAGDRRADRDRTEQLLGARRPAPQPAPDTPMDKLRRRHAAEVEAIRARRDLSDEGRRRQLAKVTLRAQGERKSLSRKAAEDAEARRARLLNTIFGNPDPRNPTAVISVRDALDRAAQLKTAEQAQQLLAQARLVGDEALARAIAMQAADKIRGRGQLGGQQWVPVLNDWAATQPRHVDEALSELFELDAAPAGITRSLSFSLPVPSELTGQNLELLARQADRNPGDDGS